MVASEAICCIQNNIERKPMMTNKIPRLLGAARKGKGQTITLD
jgi:hypothetical protein